MNATSRSNSGTSHGADSRQISDRSICSSPLPGGDGDGDNGDQVTSSQYTAEPSLGVYFEKHDHEYNDVIAAFRVSKRIIEETIHKLDQNLPYHKQIKQEIKGHEHEFTQWIFTGCGIASKKKISVKTLPLFRPLATYVRTLQDIASDLPEPGSRQSSMRDLVRRISSTASSATNGSSSSKDSSQPMGGDRRLASRIRKLTDSFQSLREHVNEFKTSEEKEGAARRLAEIARKESGISQELCLPGTRTAILGEIISLLESSAATPSESKPSEKTPSSDATNSVDSTNSSSSEERVICLVGEEGEGKSSVAATVACDMKRKGKLGGVLFITEAKPNSKSDSESSSSSNSDSKPHSPSRFLSFIRPRRRQSQHSDQSARSSSKPHLNTLSNILDKIPTNGSSEGSKGSKSDRVVVVVDGLEHVLSDDADSLMKKVSENLSSRPGLRVLVTSRSKEPSWMAHFTPPNSIKVLTLSPEPPSYMSPAQSSPDEIDENEALQLSKRNQRISRSSTLLTQSKRSNTSSASNSNSNANAIASTDDDILKYVSSRFCLDLSPSQQRLLADAAEGNFRTIVRLCDELEESGVTERGLDIVIYRELQRKHPGRVKVILA